MKSTLTLLDKMAFDVAIEDHNFTIDAKVEHGGENRGPNPKALVLAGLAGCAAMDVAAVVRKMRQPLEGLEVSAEAEVTETHPKVFGPLKVVVKATGDVDPKRLWRAVALSRDQYCGVAAMLRSHETIGYEVWLNGELVPEA